MTPEQQEYRNLLKLARNYLLAEFTGREKITVNASCFQFFKQPPENTSQQQLQLRPPIPQKKEFEKAPSPPPTSPHKQTTSPFPIPPNNPKNTQSIPPLVQEIQKKPPPTPSQETSLTEEKKCSFFKLEPLDKAKQRELFSIKKDVEKLFPDLELHNDPPHDTEAKKIIRQWQTSPLPPEVVILTFNKTAKEQQFLQNVAQAISQRLAPCVIYSAPAIEKQKAWERLLKIKQIRLVITTDYEIYSLPEMMRHYRDFKEKSERFLGETPLLLLTEISLYLKQPSLKPSLWQAINSLLQEKNRQEVYKDDEKTV